MSDHFFDFDTAMPALGAGKNVENELLTADIEDEEIDALNEETFGNDVETFDWEEDHDKFAQHEKRYRPMQHTSTLKSTPNQKYYDIHNRTVDSGYDTAERKLPSHEEIMEQSISQMVLEDELDDPAIMNITKSKPIPTTKQPINTLYSSSSSPLGLLDTEQLVSPGRMNIWGSPTQISQINQSESGLQALLHSLKSTGKSDLSFEDPSIVSASHTIPPGFPDRKLSRNLPNAKMLDEIENEFKPHQKTARTLEEVERDILLKPKARTVNEIERELTGRSSPPTPPLFNGPSMQMPIGTPPQGFTYGQHIISQSGHMSPVSIIPGGRVSPFLSQSFGMSMSTPPMGMHSPSPPLSIQSPSPPPPSISLVSPNMSPYVPWMVPPFHRGPVPTMLGHVLNNQIGMRGPMGRPGRMSPPNLAPYALAQRFPIPMPFTDHNSFQARRGVFSPNHMRFPAYNNVSHPRPIQPYRKFSDSGDYRSYNHNSPHSNYSNQSDVNHYSPQSLHHKHVNGDAGDDYDDDDDEYAGLMTQKEKDWLVKIQLLQLQSSDPYLDDFYYTTFMMKKITKETSKEEGIVSESNLDEPKLLLPQRGQTDSKAYKPVQFENSLGKLQAASVNNPRKMIDVDLPVSAEEEESKTNSSKEFKKYRQILLDLEKLYTVLLELDDMEKKILALPETARTSLYEERKSLTKQLFNGLCCQNTAADKFVQMMAVKKGKILLLRSLSYLNQEMTHVSLQLLFKNLTFIMKKDLQSEVLPKLYLPIAQILKSADLSSLVEYGQLLQNKHKEESPVQQRSHFIQALQNKFGISIMCCLITRSESLYAKDLWDLDNEQQNQWCKVILHICDIISLVPSSVIAKPLENFKLLLAHFQRFPIERVKFDILKDKLKFLQMDNC